MLDHRLYERVVFHESTRVELYDIQVLIASDTLAYNKKVTANNFTRR
jgi:hypothetical protein